MIALSKTPCTGAQIIFKWEKFKFLTDKKTQLFCISSMMYCKLILKILQTLFKKDTVIAMNIDDSF